MRKLIVALAMSLFTGTAFAQEIPAEARKQITEALGGPYVIFLEKVQDDLNLSAEQKETLTETFPERVQETMAFFQKLEGAEPAEREKELGEYRKTAHQKLAATLKTTLKEDQLKRLRQVELQREGPFALGGEVGKELKINDEQRMRFAAVHRDLMQQVQPLVKEAQSGGDPAEIRPRIMKIRKEHEGKILAILTDDQRALWKEKLGKPLDLED